jgi:type I restriction enzyme S subunit
MREGWALTALKNVCTIERTKHDGADLPYVGLEDIESHTGRHLGTTVPVSVKSSTFCFNKEHVLYGRLRPYLNKVLVPEFDGHCSSEILPLRARSTLNRKLLYYWLTWKPVVKNIDKTSTGARMPRANVSKVLDFEFPLPPLSEQERIVAILDETFAGIDTAIANTEKNLANARDLLKSYLNSVFGQEIKPGTERSLSDICENLDSKRVPITKSRRERGDIPYYGASGVVDHVAGHIFDEDLLLVSEDGANLLARTYPIAFSVSGKTWVNNHAHVLRFEKIESQIFVEHYLNSISLAPYVSGTAQPKLNQRALNSIKVPFPSIREQRLIVDRLTEIEARKERLSKIYQQKLTALAELKQSLLHKAFTGDLTAGGAERELDSAAV